MGGGKDVNSSIINIDGHERHKVRSVFDVVDEVQQYAAMEELMIFDKDNQSTMEKYFTFSMRVEYFMVGFKSVMHSFLFALLFHPVFFAVIHKKIPIFGLELNLDIIDYIYISSLSFGFSFLYLAFFIWICKFNKGIATKTMIQNFVGGVFFGSFIKMVLGFLIMNGLYFIVFTTENIGYVIEIISNIYNSDMFLGTLAGLLLGYRDGLIEAGLTSLFIGGIYMSLILIGYFYYNRQKQTLQEF